MAVERHEIVLEPTELDTRRSTQRYKLRAPGLVADEDCAYDCIIADISIGGSMLEGDLPLEKGQTIALAFDSLIGIFGEIVHKRKGFCGVKFIDNEEQALILMDWVESRLKTSRN